MAETAKTEGDVTRKENQPPESKIKEVQNGDKDEQIEWESSNESDTGVIATDTKPAQPQESEELVVKDATKLSLEQKDTKNEDDSDKVQDITQEEEVSDNG